MNTSRHRMPRRKIMIGLAACVGGFVSPQASAQSLDFEATDEIPLLLTSIDSMHIYSRNPLVEPARASDSLFNQVGGVFTNLAGQGVALRAGYIGQVLGNVSGGLERGAVYEGLLEAGLILDLDKLTRGWKGARFAASMIYPHSSGSFSELVGDVQGLSNLEAYDSVALYELWLEQNLWDDLLSIRIGKLLADAEFATSDAGGLFLNSSFGWPAFVSGNTLNTGPAYYRTAPGIRLCLTPCESWFVQAGIYDGDAFDAPDGDPSLHPHGTSFYLDGDQGAFAIAETGWLWNHGTNSPSLPGTFKLGGWLHTADFPDQFAPSRSHQGNYGGYVVAEQMVWREPGKDQDSEQGLTAFARAGASPRDRNFFQFTCDAGLTYTGLIPSRDADTTGLGFACVQVSDDFRRAERAAGAPIISDHEWVLEATYEFCCTSWWSIQPDFQWIHHPGGSRALNDAIAVGLRSRVSF